MISEIWKTAVYDGEIYEGLYKVSNLGKILSLNYKRTGKPDLMNPGTDKDGYLVVQLWKNGEYKNCLVHRLVAETFLPNPDNLPEVNHIDENKTNNFVFLNEDGSINKEKSNLEWKTHRDNCNHGTRNERMRETLTNGKLSKPVIQLSLTGDFIREWPSTKEIERQLGFDFSTVAKCCRGERKTAYGFIWMYK